MWGCRAQLYISLNLCLFELHSYRRCRIVYFIIIMRDEHINIVSPLPRDQFINQLVYSRCLFTRGLYNILYIYTSK